MTIRIFRIFITGIFIDNHALRSVFGGTKYMNEKYLYVFPLALLLASAAGCHFSAASPQDATPNSISTRSSSSAATFTGKNGRLSVAGDIIEAKDGVLTVNGIPYGMVNETSVIKYTVQGKEKVLSVNDVIRNRARD